MEDIYTVYVLYSFRFDKIYIGLTSNLIQRFYSHNQLSTKDWTRNYRPWFVIYSEVHSSKKEASLREKALKSYQGRQFIRHKYLPLYFP